MWILGLEPEFSARTKLSTPLTQVLLTFVYHLDKACVKTKLYTEKPLISLKEGNSASVLCK